MKATPYLVVDGGYAGLTPRCEVAEGHQCILGAALVGVNVVLPWREAEGRLLAPGFCQGEDATWCSWHIPGYSLHPPGMQPGCLPLSPRKPMKPSQAHPPDSYPLIVAKSCPSPQRWPAGRAGWIWGQRGGTPCAPQYRRAGWGEPAAAPCRWLPGWLWCHWDARQGLAAPGSGCPAKPRPPSNSSGWRNKLGAKRKRGGYNQADISPCLFWPGASSGAQGGDGTYRGQGQTWCKRH